MNKQDKCPKCGSKVSYPKTFKNIQFECRSISDVDGKLIYHSKTCLIATNTALQSEVEKLRKIVSDLAEWDQKNPRGKVYPIGPNDVEEQLDAICLAAHVAIAPVAKNATTALAKTSPKI